MKKLSASIIVLLALAFFLMASRPVNAVSSEYPSPVNDENALEVTYVCTSWEDTHQLSVSTTMANLGLFNQVEVSAVCAIIDLRVKDGYKVLVQTRALPGQDPSMKQLKDTLIKVTRK